MVRRSKLVSGLIAMVEWQLGCALFWVPVLVFLLVMGYSVQSFAIDRFYQQGSCLITAKGSYADQGLTPGYSNAAELPYFSYTVSTLDGRQVQSGGYDGPLHERFASQESLQGVLDRFEVGQNYACWYHPWWPSQAVLTFSGFQRMLETLGMGAGVAVLTALLALGIMTLLLSCAHSLLVRMFWIKTESRVIGHQQITVNTNHSMTISTVAFQTANGPSEVQINEYRGLGSSITLFYHRDDSERIERVKDVSFWKISLYGLLGCALLALTLWCLLAGNLLLPDPTFYQFPWHA